MKIKLTLKSIPLRNYSLDVEKLQEDVITLEVAQENVSTSDERLSLTLHYPLEHSYDSNRLDMITSSIEVHQNVEDVLITSIS
jgi:hypothetical protein